ncbi:Tubulin-tyrosine ligase family protein [Tritrichomonas foetus]|uniref:Tubulin-tyrosine ligase family protein n=1 Tax=Tritrichomonas foetus TaxID=1144522 RepID=A0A1J4KAU6_9EUKA|nr:Tubulin-tyrosine ligase family protein [Tritrichomonas foetus]|eukprot:OHT06806.1 Tubulin-tyrosine ligase family protein [Tritrichomonas foetus]
METTSEEHEKSIFDEFIESHPYPVHYVRFTAPDDSEEGQKKRKKQFLYYVSGYAARLIRAILDKSGFTETKEIDEALLIVGSALEDEKVSTLKVGQKTNHYMKTFSLGSKEGYHKLMENVTAHTGSRPNYYPESYLIPAELTELRENFETSDLWIAKPAGGARGQGIQVVTDIPKLRPGRRMIVQKYIKDPLLINGLKFDLRFYVAVPSLDPLRVYIFDNGLVRLATLPYKENLEHPEEVAAHLTNFSINRDKEGFIATDDVANDGKGNKWSHAPLWPFLESVGFSSDEIKRKIEDAVTQVILAAHSTFKEQKNHRNAFELFGFDVMIDENQNISIIEVNVTPALGTSSELDRFIKTPLVKDIFNISLIPKTPKLPKVVENLEKIMRDERKPENEEEKQPEPASTKPAKGGKNSKNSKGNKNAASTNDEEIENMEEKMKLREFVTVCEFELANQRHGGFRCIWPTKERWEEMGDLFEKKSENDEMLKKWIEFNDDEKKNFLEERYEDFKNHVSAE